jgi:hypothetical protein
MSGIVDELLASAEPSVQYKVRVGVLGEAVASDAICRLQRQIAESPRVKALLQKRDSHGRIPPIHHTYRKWSGAHWVFARLADIGYPQADKGLVPLCDQVLDFWLHPDAIRPRICDAASPTMRGGVPIVKGRARRCASQQGNALFSAVALGLVDERCARLAELLIRWQWPDGGWNCDCRPEATHSSFWETLIPLRGLARYARAAGDKDAAQAAERAAEVFLTRRLYRRLTDGRIMNGQFVKLHYPCYWRYDILFALKVMAEAGFIRDPRCKDALDLLESKRLADGGWPAEERFYKLARTPTGGCDLVSWGRVGRKFNEWVTADALSVLHAAGRLDR